MSTPRRIGFLLLGGMHHIYHLVPVAAEMAKRDGLHAVLFVRTQEEATACRHILEALGGGACTITVLPSLGKVPTLILNLKTLRSVDALVVAERTSTLLKRLPGRDVFLIHIPHGAGDRARSYDARIRFFDHTILPGIKDQDRMIDMGLVTDETSSVSGYVKTAALRRLKSNSQALFPNERPVVLYTPHFDTTLSSWPVHGEAVIEAFTAQEEFNLIVAPHIRLFERAKPSEIKRIKAMAVPGKIRIDLGSPAMIDMTYTLAADIYIGDASSQVYEFLSEPKPCVFLGPQELAWQDNPDYAHWQFGDVVFTVTTAMNAVRAARKRHSQFQDIQRQRVTRALGDGKVYAPTIAAEIISKVTP